MKHKNYAQIYNRNKIIIFSLIFLPFILVMLLFSLISKDNNSQPAFIISAVILSLVLIAFLLFYLIFYIHYKNVEFINIQTAKIVSMEVYYATRGKASLIGVIHEDGVEKEIETSSTFSTFPYSSVYVGNFLNKEVQVGYDPKWNKWVVLCDENC